MPTKGCEPQQPELWVKRATASRCSHFGYRILKQRGQPRDFLLERFSDARQRSASSKRRAWRPRNLHLCRLAAVQRVGAIRGGLECQLPRLRHVWVAHSRQTGSRSNSKAFPSASAAEIMPIRREWQEGSPTRRPRILRSGAFEKIFRKKLRERFCRTRPR